MPAHGVCSCHRLFGGALARTAHQRGYATRVFVLSRPRSTTEGIPNRASVLVGTPSVAVAIHVAAADEYNQQTTAFPRVPPPRRTVPHLGFRFCPVHERPPVVFVYRVFLRVPTVGTRVLMEEAHERIHRSTPQSVLRGHLRGPRPVTGKEQRRWHPAGTDRAEAEGLMTKLAAEETRRVESVRSLTLGAYLTSQWLPAKKLHLATSTYRGYERNVILHILPVLGRTGLRRLRYQQIESLYDSLLHPTSGKGLSPKTVYEIHLLIRNALADALRRGLITRNVALIARAPKQRSLQKIEGQAWTDEQLRTFLRTAAGHRFFPILWLTAMTGMRRNEVLGLKWTDIDTKKKRLVSLTRSGGHGVSVVTGLRR